MLALRALRVASRIHTFSIATGDIKAGCSGKIRRPFSRPFQALGLAWAFILFCFLIESPGGGVFNIW